MTEFRVRIETLEPMRVASVRVTSENPEIEAWGILSSWADSAGIGKDSDRHPVFGYTFLPPDESNQEYGYEWWVKIDSGTTASGEVREQTFPGGTYAVTTHRGLPGPEIWKRLWDWVQQSPYKWRKTHELEHPKDPLAMETDPVFDLYLPIEEPKAFEHKS